jgi:hypothetical protein
VDDVWFSELQGVEPLEPAPAAQSDDRPALRARWDTIEQRMRTYLAAVRNETLSTLPIQEPDVRSVDRMLAAPPDSPGQREPGLSGGRTRDPRLCYCREISPRATRSSSS